MSAVPPPSLALSLLPDRYAVCRLAPDAPRPRWAAGPFCSVTRTAAELSIVCPEAAVPPDVQAERGWRVLQVAGPLEFSLTGILVSLAAPLAAAAISIFALSTFDTDYLLVRDTDLPRALETLRAAGHRPQT